MGLHPVLLYLLGPDPLESLCQRLFPWPIPIAFNLSRYQVMASLLDQFPFPWSDPNAQQLLTTLTQLNPTRQAALATGQNAGLNSSDINGEQPPTFLWRDILDLAARKGLTRALVQTVFDRLSPTSPVRNYLGDLLQNRPIMVAAEPRSPDGAPKFLVNDDEIKNNESLLYGDDLMIQMGRVPRLIQTLQRLVDLAPAVCRLDVDVHGFSQYGTGFHIGKNRLLTNWHVLHSKAGIPATTLTAEFGYEDDGAGTPLSATLHACIVQLVAADQTDDWAVVETQQPLPDYMSLIPLVPTVVPTIGMPAYIIQHPNAGRKRLAYVRNQVSLVDDRVIQYLTDTEMGSSGSPVFNANGQIIGLHHAGGRPQEIADRAPMRKNEGIRISRILEGLQKAGVHFA